MIVFLESLGCCRNQVDSEIMLGRLKSEGHAVTRDPSRADVIIVNTCGFISAASQEAVDTVLAMAEYKKQGKCNRLVVTGCLPERYKKDGIEASLPEVDAFLGTGACDKIVEAVEGKPGNVLSLFQDPGRCTVKEDPHPREVTLAHSAYIKVSEGCNRKCTYCIIPRLRGLQRSRPSDAVVKEAETLVLNGAKEIILVGENTTDYGSDFIEKTDIADLLNKLSLSINTLSLTEKEICGQKISSTGQYQPWIRLLYTHPSSLDRKTISMISSLDGICTYFDVPVQHASSTILRRMGRNYTRKDLYTLFDAIREKAPDAALRTTIITGFPGETDQDFQMLLKFIEDIRFDHLGVFTYSDSNDLKSHFLQGHVPEETAMERHDILMAKQALISEEINQKYLGKTLQVLVEENPDKGIYLGRTRFQAPEVDGITFIYGSGLEIGTFVDVKITETFEYDLSGDSV